MKLLFVCGATVANGELQCASWIKSIITYLDTEYDIIVAGTESNQRSIQEIAFGKRTIQLLDIPLSDSTDQTTKELLLSVDSVLLFGTENPNHLTVLKKCQDYGILDKAVVFAQGLCCVCAQHYAEGVPERVIKRYTLRDIFRRQNIAKERESLFNRAKKEKEALELTKHFIGRTTMDRAILRKYNPTAHYYKCNDVLRSTFYEGQWKYDLCENHRIFISQYYYPLKGFHYLLDAVAQLKNKYPDIMIAAAGYNPIRKSFLQNELKDSSYIRYIKALVKKYGLQGNIKLLGELSEERMKDEYLKANVFVMPSTIENSPNSLAEAMMLGVPTIASDVGGVTDFAKHQEEAYIYPLSATYLLSYYIDKVFSDRERAESMAAKGKSRAESEYNIDNNIEQFKKVISTIAGKQ